jgi:hypothetical protein
MIKKDVLETHVPLFSKLLWFPFLAIALAPIHWKGGKFVNCNDLVPNSGKGDLVFDYCLEYNRIFLAV